MSPQELFELQQQAMAQIASLTAAVAQWENLLQAAAGFRANEDAVIYKHLYNAFGNLTRPDDFASYYASGANSQGHSVNHRIGNSILTVTVSHRALDLETVHGLDVFYQLDDWKAVAFQHKKRSRDGTFTFGDKEKKQCEKIKRLCGICPPQQKRKTKFAAPYVHPKCAAFHVIDSEDGAEELLVSACRVEDFRKDEQRSKVWKQSLLPAPVSRSASENMFLSCTLGRVLKQPEDGIDIELMKDSFLAKNDIIFSAHLVRLNEWAQQRSSIG